MRGAEFVVDGSFERASDERGFCWLWGRWRGWGATAVAAVEAVSVAAAPEVVVDAMMAGLAVVVEDVVVLVVDDA